MCTIGMEDAIQIAKYASKHCLFAWGIEAQSIHIVIKMTVVARNNF